MQITYIGIRATAAVMYAFTPKERCDAWYNSSQSFGKFLGDIDHPTFDDNLQKVIRVLTTLHMNLLYGYVGGDSSRPITITCDPHLVERCNKDLEFCTGKRDDGATRGAAYACTAPSDVVALCHEVGPQRDRFVDSPLWYRAWLILHEFAHFTEATDEVANTCDHLESRKCYALYRGDYDPPLFHSGVLDADWDGLENLMDLARNFPSIATNNIDNYVAFLVQRTRAYLFNSECSFTSPPFDTSLCP